MTTASAALAGCSAERTAAATVAAAGTAVPCAPAGTLPAKAARTTRESVLSTHRWTPSLVSIRVSRDPAFRFTPGHYARLGIAQGTDPAIFRPLSIASAPSASHLEFVCTLVPGGEFSQHLARLRAGDPVEVEKASYGFLTVDSLAPGEDLWLLASGTGLAPFVSMLRDAHVWRAFEHVVLVHSVRSAAELAYADELRHLMHAPSVPDARATLRYVPVVTREPGATPLAERIPTLLADGRLAQEAGLALDPAHSRVMACGNPDLTRALRTLLVERGFRTSRRGDRGQLAVEKYW